MMTEWKTEIDTKERESTEKEECVKEEDEK